VHESPLIATAYCSDCYVAGSFAKKNVPPHLRFLVSAESGINDGLAYPVTYFVYLLLEPISNQGAGAVAAQFITITVLYSVATAAALGFVLGALAGLIHRGCQQWLENDSLLGSTFVLALAVLGAAQLLEMNGIMACFVAGKVIS
jgi:NhaP-type Na+/H+ or K+/H+ antiporter